MEEDSHPPKEGGSDYWTRTSQNLGQEPNQFGENLTADEQMNNIGQEPNRGEGRSTAA